MLIKIKIITMKDLYLLHIADFIDFHPLHKMHIAFVCPL